MKIAELDWQQALAALRQWNTLPVEARRTYVAIKPGMGIARGEAGDDTVDALLAAGLVEKASERGNRYAVPATARKVHVLLRAMDRVRVLEAQATLPPAYLTEHFTDEQTSRLAGEAVAGYFRWGSRGQDAELVSSVDWVQPVLSFADADAARRWEQPRRAPGEESSLAVPWTLAALQRLIPRLAEHPAGVPAGALDALLPELGPAVRADAVRAGIRYLLLFPSLHGPGLEARIGLLPAIARRLGSRSAAPVPVQVEEAFEAPFRLADMTTVLVEAASEPVPVRGGDGRLYVRAARALAARLPGLPEWVADTVLEKPRYTSDDEDDTPAARRIEDAVHWLLALKLAAVRKQGERYRLAATAAGRRWLAAGEGDRLKEILAALRASPQRNPDGAFSTSGVPFFASYFGLSLPREVDLRRDLAAAFLSIPAGAMVELDAFRVHQGQDRNPFLAQGMETLRSRMVYGRAMTRELWESTWSHLLLQFVTERLTPFGGVRLGRMDDDSVAFGVTDAGRYLLGDAEDFDYAPAPEGEVLVQPDFEIVFLAPAPRVEAELGRFAERRGAGVGALFRITRASVLRAAEQGMTVDALLGTLEAVSRSGVPANVARQVRDWIGGTRRVTVKPAVLVECPDPETAGRVRSLGGAMVTEITPTVLRLDAHAKERAALVKKLRDKGIFVAD